MAMGTDRNLDTGKATDLGLRTIVLNYLVFLLELKHLNNATNISS